MKVGRRTLIIATFQALADEARWGQHPLGGRAWPLLVLDTPRRIRYGSPARCVERGAAYIHGSGRGDIKAACMHMASKAQPAPLMGPDWCSGLSWSGPLHSFSLSSVPRGFVCSSKASRFKSNQACKKEWPMASPQQQPLIYFQLA